jgi:hypothetical protein
MPCSGGHEVEGARHVATVQAAHTHVTGWLNARKAHVRQAVLGEMLLGTLSGAVGPEYHGVERH